MHTDVYALFPTEIGLRCLLCFKKAPCDWLSKKCKYPDIKRYQFLIQHLFELYGQSKLILAFTFVHCFKVLFLGFDCANQGDLWFSYDLKEAPALLSTSHCFIKKSHIFVSRRDFFSFFLFKIMLVILVTLLWILQQEATVTTQYA